MEGPDDAQLRPASEGVMSVSLRSTRLASWAIMLMAAFALAFGASSPAFAHGGKKHNAPTQQTAQQHANGAPGTQGDGHSAQQQMNQSMNDMEMDMNMDRSKMSFLERLFSWFGRLHPAIVHFPIAFFTAAWFTAIVGRRRPAFATPVQFLVIAGGIFAPVAAIAGWLTAADADPSDVLTWHRWLGTGLGIFGLLLAIWAWRRPWEDRGAGMIAALTLMGILILVQAGLGATITHGVEHLMF